MVEHNVTRIESWIEELETGKTSERPTAADAEGWAQIHGTYQI